MAEVAFDMVEQILVRSGVKDLIRCKSVCKSWQSLISSSRFVKAHLNHANKTDHDNAELGDRRICVYSGFRKECSSFYGNLTHMVVSCNGLVCVSPRDVELVVTNPSTRDETKLPTPPYKPQLHKTWLPRHSVECWGFGYDSSADDYKVISGFRKKRETIFHVFTWKTNTWKVIGQEKYKRYVGSYVGISGILCGGALHWLMMNENKTKVIISLDLSTEKFKEFPVPVDLLNECSHCHKLGVIEGCLCIYTYCNLYTSKKWVMKNNEWELYNIDRFKSKYDIVHFLTTEMDSQVTTYIHDDGRRVPSDNRILYDTILSKASYLPISMPRFDLNVFNFF